MRSIRFLGDSLKWLREFPDDARQDAGYQLDKVQRGEQPDDFKPMPSIGKGVEEIRVWDDSGTFRVIYTARVKATVVVRWWCSTYSRRRRRRRASKTSGWRARDGRS